MNCGLMANGLHGSSISFSICELRQIVDRDAGGFFS